MSKSTEQRWEARVGLSRAVRVVAFLIPVAAAVGVAYAVSRILPDPVGIFQAVLWYATLLVVSFGAVALVDQLARRLIPLAALLKLTLVFPDRAPSRFVVARNAVRTRDLEGRLEQARTGDDPDAAGEVAETILSLVAALDLHDRRTRGHSERVRVFTDMLTEELDLDEHARDRLRWASLLHDVGKLTIDTELLNKAAHPEPDEWEVIRRHPTEGQRIAGPLLPWLGEWSGAIGHHHERYDGTGYPDGLAGDDISFAGRIVTVADAYETMTAARPYKKPLSVAAAKEELAGNAGTHFDPAVVRAFLNLSLGRLRRTAGFVAWFAGLPISFGVERFGQSLALIGQATGTAVVSAGSVIALAVGGILPLPGVADAAPAPAPVAIEAASPTPSALVRSTSSPSPAPSPTAAPTPPMESPTAAVLPRLLTPDPTAGPTPKPGTTPTPVPATPPPVEPSQLGTGYLGVWESGNTESSSILPFRLSKPTTSKLHNYDTDRDDDPGLLIVPSAKGEAETNADRFQVWTVRIDSRVVFDGPASLTFWSTHRDFKKNEPGRVDAFLFDCSSSGDCNRFAAGAVSRQAWVTGSQTWVKDTISFGSVQHTMTGERFFVLKVVPNASADTEPMWFAYATSSHPTNVSATIRT